MAVFVGIDWGGGVHAVCVIDAEGTVRDRFEVGHDRAGLAALVTRLQQHGAPRVIPLAIEQPSGLLVDALVEVGFVVTPIHPNVVKACRPRYRAVAAKSDPGDAFILADILRTDGHRLRPLAPQSDAIKALRALVRGRDDLVRARVALANQLSGVLDSFWPGAARIFADVASPIALAFLERYPTPESAARLGPKRLAGFLAQHQYCGRRSPEALLGRLRSAPEGRAGEAEGEAKGDLVRALARTLQALVAELARLTSRIEHAIAELPDGRIVMSFPRAGRICAAQILAELGDVRARFPTEDQLAAEAGVAPVTYQSGKARGVGWRWACNKRLRAALTVEALGGILRGRRTNRPKGRRSGVGRGAGGRITVDLMVAPRGSRSPASSASRARYRARATPRCGSPRSRPACSRPTRTGGRPSSRRPSSPWPDPRPGGSRRGRPDPRLNSRQPGRLQHPSPGVGSVSLLRTVTPSPNFAL